MLDNRLPGRWNGRRGPRKWPPFIFFVVERQIGDTFAAVPLDFLRGSVECVLSGVQKWVQNSGAHLIVLMYGWQYTIQFRRYSHLPYAHLLYSRSVRSEIGFVSHGGEI
jgi:hypothetical protein